MPPPYPHTRSTGRAPTSQAPPTVHIGFPPEGVRESPTAGRRSISPLHGPPRRTPAHGTVRPPVACRRWRWQQVTPHAWLTTTPTRSGLERGPVHLHARPSASLAHDTAGPKESPAVPIGSRALPGASSAYLVASLAGGDQHGSVDGVLGRRTGHELRGRICFLSAAPPHAPGNGHSNRVCSPLARSTPLAHRENAPGAQA